MTRIDYSEPATLLAEEIEDYDTLNFNQTGINKDRAKLPVRYEIEELASENADDFEWQITYSFPATLRANIFNGYKYGGDYVTFRRLYLILCEHFNDGEYFIDTYFKKVYPYTMKQRVDYLMQDTKEGLLELANSNLYDVRLNNDGSLDKRFNIEKRLADYKVFAEEWENGLGEDIAREVKEDIIASLHTGIIPLNRVLDKRTIRLRERAGLDTEHLFYASGSLINSIQLNFHIGGTKRWQTNIQGIMV